LKIAGSSDIWLPLIIGAGVILTVSVEQRNRTYARDMKAIDDLNEWIRDKWHGYSDAKVDYQPPKPPFQEWEARLFMRGVDLRLYDVRASDGILEYDALGGETKKNFFYPKSSNMGREAVTQFAALTRLIEEYGYPAENILAESVKRSEAERYNLDALVFDRPRPPQGHMGPEWPTVRIGMEAKVWPRDVTKLLKQIDKCLAKGKHDKHAHTKGEKCDHKKFQGILTWQPAYFWVVSPTYNQSYLVQRDNDMTFSLKPVDDLPKFRSRVAGSSQRAIRSKLQDVKEHKPKKPKRPSQRSKPVKTRTKKPPEPEPITPPEAAKIIEAIKTRSPKEAAVAQRILDWSSQYSTGLKCTENSFQPEFLGSNAFRPMGIDRNGNLYIFNKHIQNNLPYKFSEFCRRLAEIPGDPFTKAEWFPCTNLSTLENDDALEAFLKTIAWLIEQVKRPGTFK
jgi:hypothetical protein